MEVRRRAAIDLIGSLAADRRSFETGEKCMEEQIDALRTRVQYLEGVLSSATALAESKAKDWKHFKEQVEKAGIAYARTRPDLAIHIVKDGDSWGARREDFTNLQESLSGWGDTPQEALAHLLEEEAINA